MTKTKAVIVILLIISVGLFVSLFPYKGRNPITIMGYDGPVAEIVDMEDGYGDIHYFQGIGFPTMRSVTTAAASVYPSTPDLIDLMVPSGLKMELQAAPNVISYEALDDIEIKEEDTAKEETTTHTIKQQIAKCDMSLTVTTYQGGLADAPTTTFWIQISENAYSVFTDSADGIAYILMAYTLEIPTKIGDIDTTPSAKGFVFPLTSVETEESPAWVRDYYTESIDEFRVVKFPLTVGRGHATVGIPRAESSMTFLIGIDILLLGYWKVVHAYLEWEWPDFWGNLFDALIWAFWLIVGVIATVLLLIKVKEPRMKIVSILVLWAILAFPLGWWELIYQQFQIAKYT